MCEMKKVLFTASITKHITSFHIPYLKWFKEQGYEVHVASNGDEVIPYCDNFIQVPFERNPFKISNFRSYFIIKRIISSNKYSLIHCHTPVASVITRLAGKSYRKRGTKIVYTAHGFHFFKGSKLLNWIVYLPVEKWLSKFTDCIITINDEDYNNANNFKFKAPHIKKVNGVGVDLDRFTKQSFEEKKRMRDKHGYTHDDFILIYVAELSQRKNQDLIIEAANILKNRIPHLRILLVGTGAKYDEYLVKINNLGLSENVILLGYRKDIHELMMLADIAISSAKQEGLPVNIMEAMATGLPLVATKCRGNADLVKDGINGFVIGDYNPVMMSKKIEELYINENMRYKFKQMNYELIEQFSLKTVLKSMEKIYNKLLSD